MQSRLWRRGGFTGTYRATVHNVIGYYRKHLGVQQGLHLGAKFALNMGILF